MTPAFPIRVSSNGRYFVDSSGNPFFWLGDTQWNLWRCHSLDEAEAILKDRKQKGFTVIQVMLLGWGVAIEKNDTFYVAANPSSGEAFPERDALKPNPDFFSHVDKIVKLAYDLGVVLVIGLDHPRVNLAKLDNARAYGAWVGKRYRDFSNLMWSPTYHIPDESHLPVMREIAKGLRDACGDRLMTCHPDPANPYCTSGIAHHEQWIDFNSIQTWKRLDLINESVSADYNRRPAKPVIMAEGAYEGGKEYGFEITLPILRKQAWWTFLSGGHHSYGHNDNWQVPPTWKSSLKAPGAGQMGLFKKILCDLKWWELVPDQTLFALGADSGENLNCAALAESKTWALAYLSHPCSVSLNAASLQGRKTFTAIWIDPRDGARKVAGTITGKAPMQFEVPGGWEDAVLLIGD
jgi:hypothetical protein